MSTYNKCQCGKYVPSESTHEMNCGIKKTREQVMKDREKFLREFNK